MRVTFQYQAMRYQESIQKSLGELMTAKSKRDAGRTLLNPEDDPTSYVSAINLQRMIDETTQFHQSAGFANDWLNENERVVSSLLEMIRKVKYDLALAGNNSTPASMESLIALAGDVKGVYERLFDMSNTQFMGRYIFGGFQTDTPPFVNKSNGVSSVMQIHGKGGTVSARSSFADLTEIKSGEYTVRIDRNDPNNPDVGTLTTWDKYGNPVMISSNGQDSSAKGGNSVGTSMTFKLEPGAVINTGRGVSITLPDDISTGSSVLQYQFKYEAGTDMVYNGDGGFINTRIGYNQDIPINIPGNQLFLQNSKILRGSQLNTVNGMPVTSSSKFSSIDRAKSGIGDSITISGTDHLGRPVGTAKVMGTENVRLDLRNATQEERTLTFGFGGKFYQIEIPAQGYKDTQELTTQINHLLKNATYVGAQDVSDYNNINQMNSSLNTQVNGIGVQDADQLYSVDLSRHIHVMMDGDRLSFATTATGDQTFLSVTGFKHNALGFSNKTVTGQGKDTVFEIGDSFPQSGIKPISTTHTGVDLTHVPLQFAINGKQVQVGLSSDIYDPAAMPPVVDIKAIELAFDKAIQREGFAAHSITAGLVENPDGTFDVTFTHQNINKERNTHLSTAVLQTDPLTGNVLHTNYQMATFPKDINYGTQEKTVGDLMNFIRELYDHSVEVYLEDGRIMVADLRTGESRLTMRMTENNEGMGLPMINNNTVMTGKYNGGADDQWDVRLTMTRDPVTGQQSLDIIVIDSLGITIVDKKVENYMGGAIELRSGVSIVVDNMNPFDPVMGDYLSPQSTSFNLKLTGNASLNFGDMNVQQSGKNTDAFQTLMNLYDALFNGVALNKAPSSWTNSIPSTAIPYLEGVFSGNSNAMWNYIIQSVDGKTDFHVQDRFDHTVDLPKFNPDAKETSFEIVSRCNDTGKYVTKTITVPHDDINSNEDLQKAFALAINSDKDLFKEGISAYVEDGKLKVTSNSGAKTIDTSDFVQKSSISASYTLLVPTTYTLNFFDSTAGSWRTETLTYGSGATVTIQDVLDDINSIPGLPADFASITVASAGNTLQFGSSAMPIGFTFTVSTGGDKLGLNQYDPSAALGKITQDTAFAVNVGGIEIPVELKKDWEPARVISEINEALRERGINPADATASLDENGMFRILSSNTPPTPISFIADGHTRGLTDQRQSITGQTILTSDMSGLSAEQRTLTFNYEQFNIGTGQWESAVANITLDARDYESIDGVIEAVNAKLAAHKPPITQFEAVNDGGVLGFVTSNVRGFSIEGDYSGSLGFKKAGDVAHIKVEDEKGNTIQNIRVDTANKEYGVADGISVGFGSGSLIATDKFSVGVGSGVEFELGVLEALERQLLEAITTVGNRQVRVESTMTFQTTLIQTSEQAKARYVGSTEMDLIKLTTNLELATTAYQAALASTARIMQMSILDYIR